MTNGSPSSSRRLSKIFERLWHSWTRLWFEPVPAYPLAAFRVAFGFYLLAYFLKYWFIVELAFSRNGVYSPFLIPDIAPSPAVALSIYYFTLGCIVALILGFHARISAVLVFLLFEYHYYLHFAVGNTSFDRLTAIVLFVLCFVDSGAAWSLDARGKTGAPVVPAWHIRILQFQLAALYFGTGLWKLFYPLWRTGDVLKYTLASPWATPVAFRILNLELPDWVFTALTWGVIAFELLAGFGLYYRKTRGPVMVLGAVFHITNAVVLVIPEFLNCVAMYPLFMGFYPRKVKFDPDAKGPSMQPPEALAHRCD